ncbi:TonB-dependent receptor [Caulobacter sp. Root655]|uniref:TonB-dependent receptor n=1 Tax=Caulobacter sp. Root655 TaxID=1736578 RepID=UPI0006FD712F|nr:TonB-dependent receptor [Caulobacter sp. Root655]KRA56235.1 TonB-dependent receptor [Caulobacter sp. Root655]
MSRRFVSLYWLSGVSALALAGAAHAEAPSTSGEADTAAPAVEQVVVTAERRVTDLQKTAIAISAFSEKLLADRKIDSIRDLSGQIPNFSISRVTISHTTQTYALRGVGEADPIQEPVLAVYVDDVYIPRQIGSMVEFNDLERIEVLRGPQGTLYGRNSSAGALRIITRDPGEAFRAKAEVGLGNYDAVDVRALIEGPLVEGKLAGSLSYIHHERDGVTFDPTLNHDVNRIDLDAWRAKLRWTPTDRLDVLLTVNALRDRSDTRSYVPVNQPNGEHRTDRSYSEVEPVQDLDQISGALRVRYTLNDNLKLKSVSSYGGFNLNPVAYDNDGVAALIQKNLIHYNDQYVTQEVQLNGDYGRLTFTSGAFYLHERFFVQRDGYSRRNALPSDPVTAPGSYGFARAHNITNTDAYALFGEATYALSDRFSVTGGLRWTNEKKDFVFDNKVLNLAGQVVGQSIAGQADKIFSSITPKLSAQVQWTPDVLQYVTWSKGFKSGGFDNRATRLDLATRPFAPENVDTYETGLKTELLDHRARVNLAVFYNDYKDLQVSYSDPAYPGNSVRANAGKAHTYGVELESDVRATERLSLQASAGYLFAVYDKYKNAGGIGVDADGHRLLNSPRWSLSGGLTYDVPVEIPGSIRVGVNAQYQTKTYFNALQRPQDQAPAQTFVNGTVTWLTPDPRWSVVLSGRNLLDSDKPVSATYTPATGVYIQNFPDPRTVLVTLKYAL